jgi:hypothetical protein
MQSKRPRKHVVLIWLAIDLAAVAFAAMQSFGFLGQIQGALGETVPAPTAGSMLLAPSPPWMHVGFEPLPEGFPATDFTLPRVSDGRPVRLADLRENKSVVLILSSFT